MRTNQGLTDWYWENRYQSGQTGWDVGYPSPPLMEYVFSCIEKDKKILIPGCGYGHEAGELYRKGYTDVFVCDCSQSAIKSFCSRFPFFPGNQIHIGDFFELANENYFDVILEQTFFCAIEPEFRKKYFEKCFSLLNYKGKLAGVLFSVTFAEEGPPFGGTPEEYIKYISPFFWKVLRWEPCRNSIPPRKGREWWMELEKK